MEKQLFFVINNAAVLLLSFIIAFRIFKDRSQELIILGISVLFPVIILLTVLVLGAFNVLHIYSVTVLLLSLLLLVLVKPILKLKVDSLLTHLNARSVLLIGLLLLVGVLAGYIAGRYVFTGTQFGFDDFSYHATAVGHWIKDHSIWSGPFNYHYHNPMNAEVLSFWWMLPFGQDGFAFLTGLYWLFLTCLSLFILGGRLGVAPWIRIIVLVAPFVSNVVFCQAFSRFSGVDLAGPAMILAALAFLCFRDTESQESDLPLIIFSGFACGFAVGCKVPFATMAFLLFFWIIICHKCSLRNRLKESFLFGFAVLFTGFFWYGKNIYLTGNPVFPGQLGPLAGPLTSEIQTSTKIISVLTDSGFDWKLIGDFLRQHLCWPTGIGILSLVGYLGSIVWLVFMKHPDKRVARNLSLLLFAGIVMLLTYINMPFSGRYNSPGAPVQFSLRFISCPFLIGVLLYSVLMNTSGKAKWMFTTVFFISITVALYTAGFMSNCAATVGLLGLACTSLILKPIYLPKQKAFVYAALLCMGVLLGLSMTFSHQQKRTNNNVFKYKNGTTPNGLSWKQLEAIPARATCASLGPNSYQYYPLLGRRLQHQYKALDEKGFVSERLYQRYRQSPDRTLWWPERKRVVQQPQKFLQNAVQAGVECFVITCYQDGVWPISPESFIVTGWQCVWDFEGIMIWRRTQ